MSPYAESIRANTCAARSVSSIGISPPSARCAFISRSLDRAMQAAAPDLRASRGVCFAATRSATAAATRKPRHSRELGCHRRANSDPGRRLNSKSPFLSSKYCLKTSASSSLLNSTCMITVSCARSYLNVEGAHLCLSSHSRILAISDERSASRGSFMINVRIPHPNRASDVPHISPRDGDCTTISTNRSTFSGSCQGGPYGSAVGAPLSPR